MRPKILTKPIKLEDLKHFKEIDCYSDLEKDSVHYKKVIFTQDYGGTYSNGFHPISKTILRERLDEPKYQRVIEGEYGLHAEDVLNLINSAIIDGKVVKYFSAPKTMSGYCTRVKLNVEKMF